MTMTDVPLPSCSSVILIIALRWASFFLTDIMRIHNAHSLASPYLESPHNSWLSGHFAATIPGKFKKGRQVSIPA